MQRLPGQTVDLPFRASGVVPAGDCIEFRALEDGSDVRVTLEAGSRSIFGLDAGVSRYGLHTLAFCSPTRQDYAVTVDALAHPSGATARISSLPLSGTPAHSLEPFRLLAQGFAEQHRTLAECDSGGRFAESAAAFDTAGDPVRATIAWSLAARCSALGLDRDLAGRAFHAADKHLDAMQWTRARVVLLNNHALFIAAEDVGEAQREIEQSFALQGRLHDPRLSAAIENNVCLLQHQFGDLNLAEACFARVLARHEALHTGPSSSGAARNNLALVQLSKGQYRSAATAFQRAAEERLAGDDKQGYVISMGNHALCLYQLGKLESALGELHAAYAFANDHGDHLGRAKIAEYLAGVYIAYGDSDTANAFAAEAETLYRRNNLVASLAPTLRLRARIEADRNNLDAALERISEAWSLATGTRQMQAVANIAGVYANILLDRGDLVEAGNFIHAAYRTLGRKYEAHDRLSLRAAELRWLRLSGRHQEARELASRLLRQASYPGSLRTTVLIEQFLLEFGTSGFDLSGSYKTLLAEIRHSVAMVPDPDLAFRILHIVRPAAEAAISSTLDHCPKTTECAKAALMLALEYFSLEPRIAAQPLAPEPTELRGLLQSLSSLQARDDFSAASRQLVARIKELQAAARMRAVVPQDGDCESCSRIGEGAQLIYLFGDARSWRWQRTAGAWAVRELPPWSKVAQSLHALADAQSRGEALADLSIVVADLQDSDSVDLRVGGDARTSQIPWAALHYRADEDVLDRYAVSVEVGQDRPMPARLPVTGFLASEGTGTAMLGATASEREIVRNWSARFHLILKGDASLPVEPMTLLHIAAHGQRDIGNGTSILWLKDRPLLSYLSSGQPMAETVVINACDSAAAPEFGLTQSTIAAGFLRAGTRAVVATLFPVSDNAALGFTDAFYRNFAPETRNVASAVRAAQIDLRRRRFSPYAWAAYVVVSGRPQ